MEIDRGQLVLMYEKLVEGLNQLSDGLRRIAAAVVADRNTPEEMAGILHAIANELDRVTEEA